MYSILGIDLIVHSSTDNIYFVYIWNLFITNQMYITCSYIGPFAAFPPADRNNTELSATTQNRTVSTGYQSLNNMK